MVFLAAIIVFLISHPAFAITLSLLNPIENADPQALVDHATVLKSVVKLGRIIDGETMTCTASLVDKNILLTARHCVFDEQTGRPTILKGDPILINGVQNEAIEVVRELSSFARMPIAGQITPQKNSYPVLTDAALILFHPLNCDQSATAQLPMLAIANTNQKSLLSSRVLLAGYGNSNRYHESLAGLNAGYNFAVFDDWSANEMGRMVKAQGDRIEALDLDREEIRVFTEQTQGEVMMNVRAGEKVIALSKKMNLSLSAMVSPLPGDSGGPAIAFDGASAYLVGIVSRGRDNILNSPIEIRAVDGSGKLIASSVIPERTQDNQANQDARIAAQKDVFMHLWTHAYLDFNMTALQDFMMVSSYTAITIDEYTSVISEPNRLFIENGLESLRLLRDAKPLCP